MSLRFMLEAVLHASGDLEGIAADIGEWIGEANETILVKGVPRAKRDEAARITGWNLQGSALRLSISSGRRVRAHDGLVRLRNFLASRLGEKHRIGLRALSVTRYTVEAQSPGVTIEEAQRVIGDLARIRAFENRLVIEFSDLTEKDLESRLVDRILRQIEAKPEPMKGAKLVPLGTVLAQTPHKPISETRNATETAESLGWVKRFPGRGQWIFTAPMAALVMGISDLIIDNVLRPMGFEEWMLPKLTPFEVMARMPGYFDHLAEGMIYACTPPRNPGALGEFKRDFQLRRTIGVDALKRELSDPSYVLEPAQCSPFYQLFSGETVALDELPVKAYDASGWTWRWEGQATTGLERTIEFYRVESVWLAEPEEALEIRDKEAEASLKFADKALDLEARLVVGAPFYMTSDEAAKTLVDISDPANYPTVDIEAWLPYRGARESSEWLEIGGAFTCAKDKYVKSFAVREAKNRPIWTGCGGFGITRWATALLAQHGFEFNEWPRELRQRLETPRKPLRLVTWPRA